MTNPNSRRFQHLLHNKPAKVNHNLKSFQTNFTLDGKIFSSQRYYFNDSLTFNSYDVCSRLFNAKFFQKFLHRIEHLPVQKQADESNSEKEHFDAF